MLKAVPTILLLIFVYFYLKSMLFTPLEKVLKERDALTAGARKGAEESLAAVERKQREYEQKFADARVEVYKDQEETRRKWLEEHAAQMADERARMEARVRAEKDRIASDAQVARENLTIPSTELAAQIADTLLSRKAGAA
jgi:F-type H+-transporting ATPase subunit b